MVINFSLLILSFVILGNELAFKTLIGSSLTAVAIGGFEKIFIFDSPIISNIYVSSIVGCFVIAFASAIMFYVKSSSGGTDIIALIVKKFSHIQIGKALLFTDIAVVVIGGVISGSAVFIGSFIGLIIKTFFIDIFISILISIMRRKELKSVK